MLATKTRSAALVLSEIQISETDDDGDIVEEVLPEANVYAVEFNNPAGYMRKQIHNADLINGNAGVGNHLLDFKSAGTGADPSSNFFTISIWVYLPYAELGIATAEQFDSLPNTHQKQFIFRNKGQAGSGNQGQANFDAGLFASPMRWFFKVYEGAHWSSYSQVKAYAGDYHNDTEWYEAHGNKWTNLIYTKRYNSSASQHEISIYVNGVKKATTPCSALVHNGSSASSGGSWNGQRMEFNNYALDGQPSVRMPYLLDEVMIWKNYALTDGGVASEVLAGGEIAELYNTGQDNHIQNPLNLSNNISANLFSWYRMGDGLDFEIPATLMSSFLADGCKDSGVYGTELIGEVNNREFESSTGVDWVVLDPEGGSGASVSIDSAVANKLQVVTTTDNEIEGAKLPYANLTTAVVGTRYRILATLQRTAGASTPAIFFGFAGQKIAVKAYDGDPSNGTINGTEQVYYGDVIASATDVDLTIENTSSSTTTFTVDNISVQKGGNNMETGRFETTNINIQGGLV